MANTSLQTHISSFDPETVGVLAIPYMNEQFAVVSKRPGLVRIAARRSFRATPQFDCVTEAAELTAESPHNVAARIDP